MAITYDQIGNWTEIKLEIVLKICKWRIRRYYITNEPFSATRLH